MENSVDFEVNQILGVIGNGVIGDRVAKKSSTRSNSSSSDLKSSSTTSTSSLTMNETSGQLSEQSYASGDSMLTSDDHVPSRYLLSKGSWNDDRALSQDLFSRLQMPGLTDSGASTWNPMSSNSFLGFDKVFKGISSSVENDERAFDVQFAALTDEVVDGQTPGRAEIGKTLNPSYENLLWEFEPGKDVKEMGFRFLENGSGRSDDAPALPVVAVPTLRSDNNGNIGLLDKEGNRSESADLMAHMVNNNDGWGKVPVRQDTPWIVETAADPVREAVNAAARATEVAAAAAAAAAPRDMSSAYWDSTSQMKNSGDWENQIGVWTGPPDRQQPQQNKMAADPSANDAIRNQLLRAVAPQTFGLQDREGTMNSLRGNVIGDSWGFPPVETRSVRGGNGASEWQGGGGTTGQQPQPPSHFGSSMERPQMEGRSFGDAINMYPGFNELNLLNDRIAEVVQKPDLSSLNSLLAGGLTSDNVDLNRRRPLRGQSYSGQTHNTMAGAGSMPFSDSRPSYGSSSGRGGAGRDAELRNFQRQSSLMHPQQQQQQLYHHGMNGLSRSTSVMESTSLDTRNEVADALILQPLLKQRQDLLHPLIPRNYAWQQELEKVNSAIACYQNMTEMNRPPHGAISNPFVQPGLQGTTAAAAAIDQNGWNADIMNSLIQQLLQMKTGPEFESRPVGDQGVPTMFNGRMDQQRSYGNHSSGSVGRTDNRYFERPDQSRPPNVSDFDSGTKFNRLPPGLSANDFVLGGRGGRSVSASTNHNVPWDLPAFNSSLNWLSIQHGPQITRIDSSLKVLCQKIGHIEVFFYSQSTGQALARFAHENDAITACSVIASVQFGSGRLQTELITNERAIKVLDGNIGSIWMSV